MNYSCGFVPLYKTDSDWNVLLVQHLGGSWGFPKGHVEEGETALVAAKRELYEETGLSEIRVFSDLYFEHEYSFFDKQRKKINKRVGFFVGEVYDTRVVLQKEELRGYCWKSFQGAMKLLTFESDRLILKNVFLGINSGT